MQQTNALQKCLGSSLKCNDANIMSQFTPKAHTISNMQYTNVEDMLSSVVRVQVWHAPLLHDLHYMRGCIYIGRFVVLLSPPTQGGFFSISRLEMLLSKAAVTSNVCS